MNPTNRCSVTRQALALAASSVLLLGCGLPAKLIEVPPARLGRAMMQGNWHTLEGLLEDALVTPNQGDSAMALARFVSRWRSERDASTEGLVGNYRVHFSTASPGTWLPGDFDHFYPAANYTVQRLETFGREGSGAPLLAERANRGPETIDLWYPPEIISRAVSALIAKGPTSGTTTEVAITLHDSLTHETALVDGKPVPLAADFTGAYANLLSRGKLLLRGEFGDLLTPSPRRDPRVYLMQPYDPNKETILMIHGLLDSPLGWASMTNAIWGDPELRQRYQIWHYLYNTSAPPLYSGRILREQLRELRARFDPDGNDRATTDITLVCHSMGGLVGRGLITDPGEVFWNAAFTRPLDTLILSEKDRADLIEDMYWQPDPAVRRAIFLCTPHRGTHFADGPLGRIGKVLVDPPAPFQEFYQRIARDNPGVFTPAYEDLSEGKLDSVGSLSPRHATLQILPEVPLGYPVALHSIIGNRGRPGPLEKSSDGVVPYWSSRLEGVESEKIVPSDHGAPEHPEAIAEVKRILELP